MDDFDLLQSLGLRDVNVAHFVEILARLVVAAALGAFVSYRPWRRLLARVKEVPPRAAQSQMLIAVAGVRMTAGSRGTTRRRVAKTRASQSVNRSHHGMTRAYHAITDALPEANDAAHA